VHDLRDHDRRTRLDASRINRSIRCSRSSDTTAPGVLDGASPSRSRSSCANTSCHPAGTQRHPRRTPHAPRPHPPRLRPHYRSWPRPTPRACTPRRSTGRADHAAAASAHDAADDHRDLRLHPRHHRHDARAHRVLCSVRIHVAHDHSGPPTDRRLRRRSPSPISGSPELGVRTRGRRMQPHHTQGHDRRPARQSRTSQEDQGLQD